MKRIKLLVMDVDGTLTDGRIYMGENGELMKAFNVHDGYGIAQLLPIYGIVPIIITGRESQILAHRASELNIKELYQGVLDKLTQIKTLMKKYNVNPDAVAYIGDDLNDLDCIRYCGLSASPQDAVEEVKDVVDYVCHHYGGDGAVREFINLIISMVEK